MDKEKTLAWLDAICHDALLEARSGNALPANKIGGNPAIAHYLNNVATTRNIKPGDWALWYPQYMTEADVLRVASEQAETQAEQGEQVAEQGDRIAALEGKFAELADMLKPFIEAQQEAEAEPEKPKRKSRKAAPVQVEAQEAEGEQETEPEADDAENIAEATGSDAADDADADEDEAE